MLTNNSLTWWEKYRETTTFTKYQQQLMGLLNNRKDLAQKMINLKKIKYPGKAETWYLSKIIDEIQQNDLIDNAS